MLLPNVRQNVIKQKSPNKFPSWCLLRSACHVSFFMLEKIEVIATVLIILLLLTNMWKVHLYLNKKIAECLEICAICIFRILHSLFNNSIRKKTHIKNLNLMPFLFCTALQRALPFRQQQRILSSPRQLFFTTTSDFPDGVGWWEPATAMTVAGKTPRCSWAAASDSVASGRHFRKQEETTGEVVIPLFCWRGANRATSCWTVCICCTTEWHFGVH